MCNNNKEKYRIDLYIWDIVSSSGILCTGKGILVNTFTLCAEKLCRSVETLGVAGVPWDPEGPVGPEDPGGPTPLSSLPDKLPTRACSRSLNILKGYSNWVSCQLVWIALC